MKDDDNTPANTSPLKGAYNPFSSFKRSLQMPIISSSPQLEPKVIKTTHSRYEHWLLLMQKIGMIKGEEFNRLFDMLYAYDPDSVDVAQGILDVRIEELTQIVNNHKTETPEKS